MQTKYCERPPTMDDGFELFPESDRDVITLTKIYLKADPQKATLRCDGDRLEKLYISVPELIKVSAS